MDGPSTSKPLSTAASPGPGKTPAPGTKNALSTSKSGTAAAKTGSVAAKGGKSSIKQRIVNKNPDSNMADFQTQYALDDTVFVICKGMWCLAKITKADWAPHPDNEEIKVPCYLVHYPNWSKKYDEWVMADSMMDNSPASQLKAHEENEDYKSRLPPGSSTGSIGKSATKAAPKKSAQKEKPGPKNRSTTIESEGSELVVPPASVSSEEDRGGPFPGSPKAPQVKLDRTRNRSKLSPSGSSVDLRSEEEEGAAGGIKEQAVPQKRERSDEDFNLLASEYAAFDPVHPERKTSQEEQHFLESMWSLGILPGASCDPSYTLKTAEERQAVYMTAMRKLSFINVAKRRKALDGTVLKVVLPPGLKRIMVHNYVQTVRNGKVLKMGGALSVKTVLEGYKAFRGASTGGKSIYWQKACLAEADSLLKNFNYTGNPNRGAHPLAWTFSLRHEWPLLFDLKKQKKSKDLNLTIELGPIHLIRQIQLMVHFFNQEGKRIVGFVGQQLMAIYSDIFQYIEENVAPKLLEDLDSLYMNTEEEHLKKIKFVTFESEDPEEKDPALYQFFYLSDGFLERVAKETLEGGSGDFELKVVWKSAPANAAVNHETNSG